ncbi:MAG TPA: NAD(+)/NADH kinase [Planctomycetota bacterium]|nr:NAD(+)/NADH kinase [Planctomycetota bacterium]
MPVPVGKRVLLVGDERKGGSKAVVQHHATWLVGRGCEVEIVMDRDSSLEDRHADCVVVFGGDGSLLATARRMGQHQRPTLGINRGRLGFLTAFEYEHTQRALDLLLAGELHEEQRLMFWCSMVGHDGAATEPVLGINDVVVSRAAVGGMIILRAFRGTGELATYRGDGLITATAAGSTAYSMAAGGPVLSPDLDALVLTPLASHTLSARPLVLPVGQGIEIEVVETGGRKYAHCLVDGQVQMQVPVGARVMLRPAAVRFRHLGLGTPQFFQVLHAKFGFAGMARPGAN